MDRRDFIKLGVLGAASAGGVIGCGGPGANAPLRPPLVDLDHFLSNLDLEMASITNPLSTVLKATDGNRFTFATDESKVAEDLYRDSLRSMLLVGSIGDLPAELRSDPAVQERLWGAMQEMDAAVLGMTEYLEKLPEAQRRRVQDTLRERPDLPMVMAEALDADCATLGISDKRRLHLRTIASTVGWQMRAQPLSTLVDEHVSKVRRLAARQLEMERQRVSVATPIVGGSSGGNRTLLVGGIILGAGALVSLLGLAAASGSGGIGGAFVVTAGVVLLTIGLITLIAGGIQKAVE